MASVKFCGLTRLEDAELAGRLGAAFAGVIFAGGPRLVTPPQAARLFSALPPGVRRVGVFGSQEPRAVADIVAEAGLDAVQLHATDRLVDLEAIRAAIPPEVELWSVVRVAGSGLPAHFGELAAASDATVVDSLVAGQLGGSGVAVEWSGLGAELDLVGRPRRLVLAGGLRPENVARAVSLVAPDVVDVSSGVESAPGLKDASRMIAFSRAAGAPQPIA